MSQLRILQSGSGCQRRAPSSAAAARPAAAAALHDEVAGQRLQLRTSLERHLAPLAPHLAVPQSREDEAEHDDDTRGRQARRSGHLQRQSLRLSQVEVDETDHL